MSSLLSSLSQICPQFSEPYRDIKVLAVYLAIGIFLLGLAKIVFRRGGDN